MKRIATPIVGGLVSSFALQLTIYPAIFAMWKGPPFRNGWFSRDRGDRPSGERA